MADNSNGNLGLLGLALSGNTPSYWRARFESWTKPQSDNEEDKIVRTARMIKSALATCRTDDAINSSVFGKGSYKNNTNVRLIWFLVRLVGHNCFLRNILVPPPIMSYVRTGL